MQANELRSEMGTLRAELAQSKASNSIFASSSEGAEAMLEQERKRFAEMEEACKNAESQVRTGLKIEYPNEFNIVVSIFHSF